MSCREVWMRAAQCAVNNAVQSIAAAGTTVAVLGDLVTDTGVSLQTQQNGFQVTNAGLYRFSYDVTFTAGATAGNAVLQLYNGTAALPCAYAIETVDADGVCTMHAETVLRLNTCCMNRPVISAQMSGIAGSVVHVCANAVKLA